MSVQSILKKNLLFTLFFFICWSQANSAGLDFKNITSDDFSKLNNELSAYSSYSSVSSAAGSTIRDIGFEIGLIGNLTLTPNINTIVEQTDPTIGFPRLPGGALLVAVSLPMTFKIEVLLLPQISFNDLSYQQFGVAVQYRILSAPLTTVLKAHITKTASSFTEILSNASTQNLPTNIQVNFEDTLLGLDLITSQNFVFAEPYFGLGYETANANLDVSGSTTASIFAPAFTTAQTAGTNPTSLRILIGAEFKLLSARLGAEYLRAFETNRFNIKLSLAF